MNRHFVYLLLLLILCSVTQAASLLTTIKTMYAEQTNSTIETQIAVLQARVAEIATFDSKVGLGLLLILLFLVMVLFFSNVLMFACFWTMHHRRHVGTDFAKNDSDTESDNALIQPSYDGQNPFGLAQMSFPELNNKI